MNEELKMSELGGFGVGGLFGIPGYAGILGLFFLVLVVMCVGLKGRELWVGGVVGGWRGFFKGRTGLLLKRKRFLTGNEVHFFHLLSGAVGSGYVVCPQVGLGALMDVDRGMVSEAEYWDMKGEFGFKLVDFVICERAGMEPVLVVELDDVSHERGRDIKRGGYMGVVGVPVVRFWSKSKPSEGELRVVLSKHLGF